MTLDEVKCEICKKEYPSKYYLKANRICLDCYEKLPLEKKREVDQADESQRASELMEEGVKKKKVIRKLKESGWSEDLAVEFANNKEKDIRQKKEIAKKRFDEIARSMGWAWTLFFGALASFLFRSGLTIYKNGHNWGSLLMAIGTFIFIGVVSWTKPWYRWFLGLLIGFALADAIF